MSKKISSRKIVSNISWSLAEKLLTDFVSAIVAIILARILYPEDYGLVSLVQIFVTISTVFVTCGLGTSLIQYKNADEDQISTIFYTNIFVGLILYVIIFVSAPYLALLKGNNSLTEIIRVLGIKVPISSVYSMYHSYIQKRMEFKRFFFSSLIGTLTAGVVGVTMAYKGFGAWALVFSTLIDQIMDCFFLFCSLRWIPKFQLSFNKTKKLFDFGFKTLLTELLSRVYNKIRPLIIGLKFTSADLAYSVKGEKYPEMANELTNAIVLKVMFPVFSELQEDKEQLLDALRNSVSVSMFVLAPVMIGLACTAYNSVPLILTDKWNLCIPYIQITCMTYLLSPISSLNNKVMQACGKSGEILKLNLISIVLDILLIIMVIVRFDSPVILATSSLIHTLIMFVVYFYVANKMIGYSPIKLIEDIGLTLITSFVMGIIVYGIGNLTIHKLLLLVIQIIVGITIYVLMSFVCKNKSMKYIFDILKLKENKHE